MEIVHFIKKKKCVQFSSGTFLFFCSNTTIQVDILEKMEEG